ncbi:Aste57867_4142 [Aphanomyces stellatus]|uniref:Aste57867_4142 protein n=1 Tax=Aphanomyces stellatus TaxID=120398 RepID=A0A485KB03_9STRA|nr:hypothetical protein As57867_004131 [Aphanomyces stellatus]VFT81269.1 Aste57867_4142 [Aphanomyces stellatus]
MPPKLLEVKPRDKTMQNLKKLDTARRRLSSVGTTAGDDVGAEWLGGRVTIHKPMRHRDPKEIHRVSSALEKLFDLTLVVALSAVSRQFAANLMAGTTAEVVVTNTIVFVMSFFTIWNTWFPFVWFATTYDVDDVCFRLATLGEMVGVLMISDGIAHDPTEIVDGYILLRFCHSFLLRFRAAYQDPDRREVNLKHGALSALVMLCWYFQQTYAKSIVAQASSFAFLAICDLAAPYIAQRTSKTKTKYHAHHVTDRYSEFTIMVFGESILSLSHATVMKSDGVFNLEAVSTCVASLVLLFALWWVYFLVPYGQILHDNPSLTYVVGYGHFFVHAPLAAFATGIYMAGLATRHPMAATEANERRLSDSSATTTSMDTMSLTAFTIATSVTVYLVVIPLMLNLPRTILARNSLAGLVMLLLAAFVAPHVSVSTLMWLFCLPVTLTLVHILVSHRNKQKYQMPAAVAATG